MAQVILDNLIAWGRAQPMLVVMPLGYGLPEIVDRHSGKSLDRNPGLRDLNYERFTASLFQEVMPRVEAEYRTLPGRASRAIAGLSMGGAESLLVGLNHPDDFAWIGSFSAGAVPSDYAGSFPRVDAALGARLSLLWIACGTEDRLIAPNRRFRAWLESRGVHPIAVETPGAHTWPVWRRNLTAFAPLLFQPSKDTR